MPAPLNRQKKRNGHCPWRLIDSSSIQNVSFVVNMTNKERDDMIKEHNTRLTSLEKWRWLLTGGFLVLSIQNFPVLKEVLPHTLSVIQIMYMQTLATVLPTFIATAAK